MNKRDYYIGLDIGTESVGWAVTDESYTLKKCAGKALWGVRLFDEAKTAEERRTFRIARRRAERQHERILWLQEQFQEEIGKVDPAFFQRMRESKFLEEDKQSDFPLGRYTLFCDRGYSDKDYHRDYPTIYHLRKQLIESDGPVDIRLVYLTIHHIMKHRGHFLFGELSMDSVTFEEGVERLNRYLLDEYDTKLVLADSEQFSATLIDRKCNTTQKRKHLFESAPAAKDDDMLCAVIDLLSGRTVHLDKLYGEKPENGEIDKLCLQDDFDAVEDKLIDALGDRIELILAVKEIYDWALLKELLDGERYLSFAKAKSYDKHRADLSKLKKVIRGSGDVDLYKEIFHTSKEKLNNYVAYSGKNAENYRCGEDDFRIYLKKKLAMLPETEEIKGILASLEAGEFLPKQSVKDNGVIPHQLHLAELKVILENAEKQFSFLAEKDGSGLTKSEQIIEMFNFKIPYYVGPLNAASSHAWVVRSGEKIYPWNFDKVVDLEKSAEGFITRMTAKCSYIGEDVLPKDSLLYSKFTVLNELNNLKINGRTISVAEKQAIFNNLFMQGKKVTAKRLRDYLMSSGAMSRGDEISGIDGDFKSNLSSWSAFSWLLGRKDGEGAAEEIIRHIVLFGEDRKLLGSWLRKTYGQLLSREEEKKILGMRFSGWGKLSKIFLTEIYHTDKNTGEAVSIMQALWDTNENLMELLSSRYTFGQAVEKYREENKNGGQTLTEYLEGSYASPAIRRAIRQTIRIVAEIEKIMGHAPKRVFVEMARSSEKKSNRFQSRKERLAELYKKCDNEANELFTQLDGCTDGELRRDKLYLYYTQLGKCMYSGEPIALERLDADYDIEHIYPQSRVKDDSLANRVLVKRELNSQKSDTYPISANIRHKMQPFWAALKSKELIDSEKFARLIRATEFTPDELSGFVARQLVETQQSSKIVAELLQGRYGKKTEIVYVKAGNVSSFRQDQRIDSEGHQRQAGQCRKNARTEQDPLFVKCREVNDFHHAKDAYLNIVVGNVYHTKFTRNFFKKDTPVYSLNRMFDFDVTQGGETAWKTGSDGSITVVRNTMRKNNVLFTRMASKVEGGFFDQTIMPKGKGQTQIKSADPRMSIGKFGGYNKLTSSYFFLVEHTEKKKRVCSIETVLLLHRALYERAPEEYCRSILGLSEPCVLIREIKINSLVELDGFRMHISGRQNTQIIYKNANQLVIEPEQQKYIKGISKYLDRCKAAKSELQITRFDGITSEENVELYGVLLNKLKNSRYCIKYNTAAKTVEAQAEKFTKLSLSDQCRVLMQILNLFSNTAESADLKLLCGKSGIGIILTSKNLYNYEGHSFKLIHQSVTGVFEQEIDLIKGGL